MKKYFHILILFFVLTSCGIMTSHKKTACNCCDKSYTNIDSAMNCILQTPDTLTTADDRLFLIAFVNKDVEANQKLGWNILKDPDIINTARRNYLLIILDVNQIKILKDQTTPELIEKIKGHKEPLFFVIANQALYPFADWTINEKKDFIIGRLEVGNGP